MSKTMEKARKGSAEAMQTSYTMPAKTALCIPSITIREEAAATE